MPDYEPTNPVEQAYTLEPADCHHRYPPGTVVSVHDPLAQVAGGPPRGATITTGTVLQNGLTFLGLTAGQAYVMYALVDGQHRYLRFSLRRSVRRLTWREELAQREDDRRQGRRLRRPAET